MSHKFRKKPVEIEAFQMTRDRADPLTVKWPEWLLMAWDLPPDVPGSLQISDLAGEEFEIFTLEGIHLVSWGDWIIRGVEGELYPCKPEIFAATYEAV